MTELGMVREEIRFHLKHLGHWAGTKRVPTPLSQFPARSIRHPEPYGVVLIMAPWNYPIQLSLEPLIGAISAGNCAVLKPSAYAPACSHALKELISACLPDNWVTVVEGGRRKTRPCWSSPSTISSSPAAWRWAAMSWRWPPGTLTPVTLELGGKSPVIVTADADLPLRPAHHLRQALNAGQTCVAPDYLLVNRKVQEKLTELLQQEITHFLGQTPLDAPNYPKIINEKHLHRLESLLTGGRMVCGGTVKDGRIAPTLMDNLEPDAPVMQEEIFGPILPILPFDTLEEAMDFVSRRPKPLALYLFSRDKGVQKKVLTRLSFGGGCLNDTIVHLTSPHLPFGGVGASGMGAYHGKASFDTFTHVKSILIRGSRPDLDLRYHPYSDKKERLLRRFLR